LIHHLTGSSLGEALVVHRSIHFSPEGGGAIAKHDILAGLEDTPVYPGGMVAPKKIDRTLSWTITDLTARVKELEAENARLEARVAELEAGRDGALAPLRELQKQLELGAFMSGRGPVG